MKEEIPSEMPAKQPAVFDYDLASYQPTGEEWALFQDLHSTISYDLSGASMTELSPFFEETRSLIQCLADREPVGGFPHTEDIAAGVNIFESWAGDLTPAQPIIVLLQQIRARDVLIVQMEDEVNWLNSELEKLKKPLFTGSPHDLHPRDEPKATGKFTREINRKPVTE